MQEATQATTESPLIACAREAATLRAYCESRFPVGKARARMHSVTGEMPRSRRVISPVTGEIYTGMACSWHDGFATAEAARESAQAAFDGYAQGKSGTLYWHVPPDIAFGPKQRKYVYFLRLLISDKPPISTKEF